MRRQGPVRVKTQISLGTFFETAVDLLSVADLDGYFRAVSPSWQRTTGWTPEDLVGAPYLDYVHPDDVTPTRDALQSLRHGGILSNVLTRFRDSQGSWRDFEWSAALGADDGLIYCTIRDVTGIRRALTHLGRIEEVSGVGSWEVDVATNAVFWSDQTYRIHDLDPGGPVDMQRALDFFQPEDRAAIIARVDRLVRDGTPYDFEAPFTTAKGRHIWVRATAAVEWRGGKIARAYGTFQDITAKHQEKLELERLGNVAAHTTNPVLVTDADRRITWANAAFEHRSGFTLAEVLGASPIDLLGQGHADSIALRTLTTALDRGIPARVETMTRMRDGQVYWIDIDVQPTRSPSGDVQGFVIVQTDITERKALEAKLESERNRLRATLDAIPDLLFEMDAEGRYVGFHSGTQSDLAIPPDVFLGRRQDEVHPPEIAAIGREAMREVDETGHSIGKRYAMTLQDGVHWYELSAASRAADTPGQKPGYLFLARDITPRFEAEAKLLYREELLEALFNLSPIGIALNDMATGHFLDVNATLAATTGYSRAEFRALTQAEITPCDHAETDRIQAETLHRTGRFGPYEKELIRKDGTRLPVVVNGLHIVDNTGRSLIWSLIEDISERKEREQRLEQAERAAVAAREQLLTAVESLPDGFVLYDAEDRLVIANSRYKEIYAESAAMMVPGTRFEDILRYGLSQAQYDDSLGREEEWLAQRLAKHNNPGPMIEQRLGNGRVLRIFERKTPDGGSVGLRVDVTELYEARERAEEASRTKSLFLANISLEIRTPLNGILGMADILSSELTDPAHQRVAHTIRESGETLLTILNDLLDMSKIEAGKLDLEEAPFSPLDLAAKVEALHSLRAHDKGLTFRIDHLPGAGVMRLGDAHRVAQILHNLLSNAVKFTESGGVILRVGGPADGPLIFEVADTGIGMSAEQTARIFEDFEQADRSVTRRYGGTGLGMSIVRRLVEMMKGQITVDSTPGTGTTVRLSLPLPPTRRAPAPQPPLAEVTKADLSGLRALVADDNPINLQILDAFLRRLGMEVTLVENGRRAVEAWSPHRFDVLCLDIAMPELDGISALSEIRSRAAASNSPMPPAIAVTANAMAHQVQDYLAAGFDGHLAKPVRRSEIAREIARLVPQRAQNSAPAPGG